MGHCPLLLAEAYGSSASALGMLPGGQKDRETKGSVGSSSITSGSLCQGGMAALQHRGLPAQPGARCAHADAPLGSDAATFAGGTVRVGSSVSVEELVDVRVQVVVQRL